MSKFLQCDALVSGKNDKFRRSNNQSQLQFYGGLVFFVPLQEQFAENANKMHHICKVICVLHSCHKIFGIR